MFGRGDGNRAGGFRGNSEIAKNWKDKGHASLREKKNKGIGQGTEKWIRKEKIFCGIENSVMLTESFFRKAWWY